MVEMGSAGVAASSDRCCGRICHQAQLDDTWYLGPFSRSPSQGVMAGEQEQLVTDPGHPLLRRSRGDCHRGAGKFGYFAFAGSETARLVRPTIAGNLLPRHPAVSAWAFRSFG